jgi:hypothetical protein
MGAKSRPRDLLGVNDPFGAADSSTGVPLAPVFTLYTGWAGLTGADSVSKARASIARGEQIFNTRPIVITGVAGLRQLCSARCWSPAEKTRIV